MLGEEIPSLCSEDIHNIPRILWNLDVQEMDQSSIPLKVTSFLCLVQGTGDPCHVGLWDQMARMATFGGRMVHGHSPQSLASVGLFLSGKNNLVC